MRTMFLQTFSKVVSLTICLLLTAQFARAQTTLSGYVYDPSGGGMPGVSILIKGTTTGVTTDLTGKFSLLASEDDVLLISFLGYKPQEIRVGNKTNIKVTLEEDVAALEELIVYGYGSVKKSDLTGAVASVNETQLRASVTANIDQALQGRIAGVQVTQNSGQPGGAISIRIRGASSINGSNEPLYVIDGIQFQGDGKEVAGFSWAGGANGQSRVNALSTINPNDIVSIEVLKDASATAIYGSRAANGVVMITTRRGKAGDSKISYNGYYGVQSLRKREEMMDLPQFAEYQLQISDELNLQPNSRYLDPSLLGKGTDWQDEIFQDAPMQSHQLSISGGTDKSTYAISGGYFTQGGIVIGSNFDRFTTRVNLSNQVKDWVSIGANLSYANTRETITLNDGGDGVIMQSLLMQPDVPVKDIDGNYAGPDNNLGVSYNPVASALLRNNTLDRNRIMANFYTDATIIKGLVYRSEISFDANNSFNKSFQPTYKWGALENTENMLRQREEESFFWVWKNYLTYNLTSGAHQLTAMLGTEAQKSTYQWSDVIKRNFATNEIPVLSQGDNQGTTTNGGKGASSLLSYFGRFNYNFKDRYLATFTLRADGSSKFGSENKWGYFPSASIKWKAINEDFLTPLFTYFNDFSVRLGYGAVGNQAIPDFLYGSSLVTLNTGFGTAYRNEKYSNPLLKWETSIQYNLGFDIAILESRIGLTLDLYKKQTTDMLLPVVLPDYLGGSDWWDVQAPYANIGKMENKGVEISLNSVNIEKSNFSWKTDINLSVNRNKLVSLNANSSSALPGSLNWYSEFQTATYSRAGHPLGVFYGYITEGIFANEQEILDHAVQVVNPTTITEEDPNGVNLVHNRDGVWIGDIKFKDLNDDGVINTLDQTNIGDPNPKFTFGFNNNFTYGPFDFSVYVTGAYGADVLNYTRVVTEGQTNLFSNQSVNVSNRAQFDLIDPAGSDIDPSNVILANPGTNMPRFATNDLNRNNRMSDRFIEDGSYARIQNITVAYTLPVSLTQRAKINRLRVYASGQNLFVLTKYSGFDPEIGAFNQSPLLQNIDMGRYPSPRVVTMGVDIDF